MFQPRAILAKATVDNETQSVIKAFAKQTREGYHEDNGIVFRSRLDMFGAT